MQNLIYLPLNDSQAILQSYLFFRVFVSVVVSVVLKGLFKMSTRFKMNVDYLLAGELEHELLYRGVDVPATVAERRRTLRGAISQEASNRSTIIYTENFDFDSEVEGIKITIRDLEFKIRAFVGIVTDIEYARLTCRLAHVTGRASRLQCSTEAQEKVKKNLLQEIYSLEGDLDLKVHISAPGAHSTPIQNQNFPFTKSVPIHKWGIFFTGSDERDSVVSFLEKVECMRAARGVSDVELFSSAADLFKHNAFTWYLNNRGKFVSWVELVDKLKADFLPYNYQDDLLEEIKNRRQYPKEKIAIFVNNMMGLFNRLEVKPDEKTIIKIIRRNLLPTFSQPLALIDIDSVDSLCEKCKRIEESLQWNQGCSSNSGVKSRTYLEPDLNVPGVSNPRNFNKNYKNTSVVSYSNIVCWNCHQSGHKFNQCKLPRKIFCYGCGQVGTTKFRCKFCSKNGYASGATKYFPPPVTARQQANGKSLEKKGKTSSNPQSTENPHTSQ